MTLKDELAKYVKDTHASKWTRHEGLKVPEPKDLTAANDGIDLDGTVLYADLAESTALVKGHKDWFAAEVYKNYLYCASRLIRATGGTITAYDGDRVMGVYIGKTKNTDAVDCALKLNHVVDHIIRPALKERYPKTTYYLRHKVGIDTSSLLVAKTGVRGDTDLVWVGRAANNAAKMAALPTKYSTYISATVYGQMLERARMGGNPKENMWTDLGTDDLGYRIYGSSWRRSP